MTNAPIDLAEKVTSFSERTDRWTLAGA